jgi:hypothetical protein
MLEPRALTTSVLGSVARRPAGCAAPAGPGRAVVEVSAGITPASAVPSVPTGAAARVSGPTQHDAGREHSVGRKRAGLHPLPAEQRWPGAGPPDRAAAVSRGGAGRAGSDHDTGGPSDGRLVGQIAIDMYSWWLQYSTVRQRQAGVGLCQRLCVIWYTCVVYLVGIKKV